MKNKHFESFKTTLFWTLFTDRAKSQFLKLRNRAQDREAAFKNAIAQKDTEIENLEKDLYKAMDAEFVLNKILARHDKPFIEEKQTVKELSKIYKLTKGSESAKMKAVVERLSDMMENGE